MSEHRVIEKLLDVLEIVLSRIESRETINKEFFDTVIDFARNFIDKCHHGKEEEALFPLLEERGVSREGGPIGVMLFEHELGRDLVKELEDAVKRFYGGDQEATRDFVSAAREYISLLRQHIAKEDNVLFVIADQVIQEDEDTELIEKFERIEIERIGPGKHEEYIRRVEELAEKFLSKHK